MASSSEKLAESLKLLKDHQGKRQHEAFINNHYIMLMRLPRSVHSPRSNWDKKRNEISDD